MQKTQNPIIWHELITKDVGAAARFYADTLGLESNERKMGKQSMNILSASDQSIAAIVNVPQDLVAGFSKSLWVSYVWVENIDTALARASKLGSKTRKAPIEIAGVGHSAILEDPQGAVFGLFTPEGENANHGIKSAKRLGHVVWHELYADDPKAAFAFYAELFGWGKGQSMPMGPAGDYQLFSLGDDPIGGIMKRPNDFKQVLWNPFFEVENIVAAQDRIMALKGIIFDGLRQVPDGDWTLKCVDPQGATFALSGPKI